VCDEILRLFLSTCLARGTKFLSAFVINVQYNKISTINILDRLGIIVHEDPQSPSGSPAPFSVVLGWCRSEGTSRIERMCSSVSKLGSGIP
jgi:hypothetical protein